MITGFKGAIGSASITFLIMAGVAWVALPFAHPVYALVVPPNLVGGVVFAILRRREPRHPTLRDP